MIQLRVGETTSGYKLMEQIGRGGMGIVFLAEHLALRRLCALKFLAPSLVSNTSLIMFQNEAKLVAGLHHPMICRIYDMGIHDGKLPFYAMDYLIGETLDSVLQQQRTLSAGAAVEVFLRVAEGLSYAHGQGIVHKDIKPSNIMLLPGPDESIGVNILDFGIAELIETDDDARAQRDIIGSTFYMSPEQISGSALDHRSDIYSLGCSLFETLTGAPPFTGTTAAIGRQHLQDPVPTLHDRTGIEFPPALEAVLQRCLEKSADDRYQSASALAVDLQSILSEEDRLEEPIEKEATPTPTSDQSSLIILSLAIVAVIGLCCYMLISASDSPTRKKQAASTTSAEKDIDVEFAHKPASTNKDGTPHDNYEDVVAEKAQSYTVNTNGSRFIKRGLMFGELGESARAVEDINFGLKQSPELWNLHVSDGLSKSYVDLEQFDNALTEINKSLQFEKNAFRLRLKGQILYKLDRPTEALAMFDETLKSFPKDYWTYFDRGNCHAGLKHYSQALADFTKVIELDPTQARGYGARAAIYKKMGKLDLAKKDEEQATKMVSAEGLRDPSQ